jgi:membrane associated rhomboid family serine protease
MVEVSNLRRRLWFLFPNVVHFSLRTLMRPPLSIRYFPRVPITSGTILLATGVSLAFWGQVDIGPIVANPMIGRGEVWRLLTSTLPHADPFHLLFNAYWIWTFGALIEITFGHFAALGIFLLLASGSMAAEWAVLRGGVGLSGVGYGLFGLIYILEQRDPRFEDAVDRQTTIIFIGWFFLCVLTTVLGIFPVANIAHGTGWLLGILLGLAITEKLGRRTAVIVGLVVMQCLFLIGATVARPYVNRSAIAAEEVETMGYDALEENRDADAVAWLKQAVRMEPTVGRAWQNLGIAYLRTGQERLAASAFIKAGRLKPQAEQSP